MRIVKWTDGEREEDGISVRRAKQLLRKEGGSAWTRFYDRDGSFQETTKIELKKNNTTKVKLSNCYKLAGYQLPSYKLANTKDEVCNVYGK